MSRPSKSVYTQTDKLFSTWRNVGRALIATDEKENYWVNITRSEKNFYSKTLRRELNSFNKYIGVNIPLRPELCEVLRRKPKQKVAIKHPMGEYEVLPFEGATQISYTPNGYTQRVIKLDNKSLDRVFAVLDLFDYFMRDDEDLETTLGRFLYMLVPNGRVKHHIDQAYEKTGIHIAKLTQDEMDQLKYPEPGENDEAAIAFFKDIIGLEP